MIQRPKGTKDLLLQDSAKWQYIENAVNELMENYGYKEIRVPVFELTELCNFPFWKFLGGTWNKN